MTNKKRTSIWLDEELKLAVLTRLLELRKEGKPYMSMSWLLERLLRVWLKKESD